ncbi:MAG: Methyl-accepting chemotaxis sensory transducer [uncultured bacterium]|nr:MAG: Methyl-accepting chemotaxis sensory transducer [uncultured bacterium]
MVAEEVRNLAARSARSVRETSDLIDSSSITFAQGMDVAGKTATALTEIVESITKTTLLAQKISEASTDQAMSVAQINIGLEQIDKVTQQNALEAERSLTDSQELASQADELHMLLSSFVLPEESE